MGKGDQLSCELLRDWQVPEESICADDKSGKCGDRFCFKTQGRHHENFETRVLVAQQKGLNDLQFF